MRRTIGRSQSYQQTNKIAQLSQTEKKRLYILAAVLLLIGLIGATLAPGIGGVALYRQHQQALIAKEINAKLRTDNEQGQKSIKTAMSNPDYLEQVSRAEFNLLQPDEVIFDYSKKN